MSASLLLICKARPARVLPELCFTPVAGQRWHRGCRYRLRRDPATRPPPWASLLGSPAGMDHRSPAHHQLFLGNTAQSQAPGPPAWPWPSLPRHWWCRPWRGKTTGLRSHVPPYSVLHVHYNHVLILPWKIFRCFYVAQAFGITFGFQSCLQQRTRISLVKYHHMSSTEGRLESLQIQNRGV